MYFSRLTNQSTVSFSKQIAKLQAALDASDAVIIGAGAGLSTAAGYTYSGERFENLFGDFAARYGFADMYSGGFYPYDSLEEYWAFWSRYIECNRYDPIPKPVYEQLLDLLHDRDYFVLTTNVDHCFQRAGFDKQRLFYTQGDYGLFQCSKPCRQETWDNEGLVHCMVGAQQDLRILFFELGVGGNTPVIIKYPFWQMTAKNERATYACINFGEAVAPAEIADRSILIDADAERVLDALAVQAVG